MKLPSGTVTFLFTDIEGSTKLAQSLGDQWETLRARHHEILKSAIESNNGYVFQVVGDEFCAAFHTAGDAVCAASQAQINLHTEDWGKSPVKVRMGINTGTALASVDTDHSGGYKGYTAMARVQRIMSAGHGGQVLISLATEELVRDDLPENVSLLDMEECRLKDLIRPERIHQLVIQDLPDEFPPLKTLDIHRHNLPIQLTSFIGREKEIADISEMIKDYRLVTLTGIGGTGKTRLSLQVAADLIDEYPDGVWFVQLAPLSDPTLVPQEVASVWQIENQSGGSLTKVLSDYARKKNLLLVLDNCEHVIEACSSLANDLLHTGSKIKILATSRVNLNIEGETTYPVHPLALPEPRQNLPLPNLTQYEAVRLFIERAVSVRPTFSITNENAPAVVQICQQLDGIPLAIELAAARIRALSPDQIAERLENRFELLTGGNRTVLPRQQTLRATMDWSYELLTEDERDLLNQLSVFAGDFSLEAVESICIPDEESGADVLDLLTTLVDNSLVNIHDEGSEIRYQLLETVRQYGDEKLSDSGKVDLFRSRHFEYFLELAKTAEPHLVSSKQLQWLANLDTEYENIRAALIYSLSKENNIKAGMRLANALYWYWGMRTYTDEELHWQKIALDKDLTSQDKPLRAKLLYQYGQQVLFLRGIHKESLLLLEESLQIFKDLGDEYLSDYAYVLTWLGYVAAVWQGNDKGKLQVQKAIEIFENVEDKRGQGWALGCLSLLLLYNEGKIQPALEALKKGAALYSDHGDRFGYAMNIGNIGRIYLSQGHYDDAIKYAEESAALSKEFRNKGYRNLTSNSLGDAHRGLGNYKEAEAYYRESLVLRQEAGVGPNYFIEVYLNLGYSVLQQEKEQEAVS